MSDLPIDLGDVIIDPTLLYPIGDIGVEVVVVLQTVGIATRSVRSAFLVAVDAEGTDTEAYPRLGEQDGTFQFPDQGIHVLPAPIVPLRLAVSFSQAVFPEAVIIRERHTRRRIGIEIIVHMDRVHVVTADDITHYPADKLTAFRQSRVEKDLFIIGDKPFGMLMIDVGIGETGVSRRARPVRIQPSVKLHVPFMAFLDQEGHRVELTCRGYALLSGEEAAPRLDIGFIESVRLGAHLKDDGVDAACLQVIKLADEVFFHPGGSHILVFALKSGLYPCSPKLSLGLLARTRSRTRLLANRRT